MAELWVNGIKIIETGDSMSALTINGTLRVNQGKLGTSLSGYCIIDGDQLSKPFSFRLWSVMKRFCRVML